MGRTKRQVTAGYEMSDEARMAVDRFVAKKGMKKKELVGRVMRWFGEQREPIQAVVAGTVDEGMQEAYAKLLDELAADIRQAIKPASGPLTGGAKATRDATPRPENGGLAK